MGILDRISRLVRANVNDMLDRAEDPELMLDQILRDMESNIQLARGQVASMIAQDKELQADLKEVQDLSQEWQTKASRAVEAGKDDLAREALRRKKDNDESATLYQQQLTAQSQTVDKLKSQLAALESKYQSTLSNRDALIAQFAELDYDTDVEAELEALKANVGKAPEPLGTGDQTTGQSA